MPFKFKNTRIVVFPPIGAVVVVVLLLVEQLYDRLFVSFIQSPCVHCNQYMAHFYTFLLFLILSPDGAYVQFLHTYFKLHRNHLKFYSAISFKSIGGFWSLFPPIDLHKSLANQRQWNEVEFGKEDGT